MFSTRLRAPLVPLLLVPLLAGCWLDASTTRHDGTIHATAELATVDPAVGTGIVRLLNDWSTDVPYLHDTVGLDGRVAAALVADRQGPDALDGTADDLPFEVLQDVFDVDGVTDLAVRMLGDAAMDEDLVPVRSIEGVRFSAKELTDTLDLVNHGHEADLADLLDRRALDSILAARPFEGMTDVAAEPYVGPAALRDLRDGAAEAAEEEAA